MSKEIKHSPLNNTLGASQELVPVAIAVIALVVLFIFFGPDNNDSAPIENTSSTKSESIENDNLETKKTNLPPTLPSGAKIVKGDASNPPAGLPKDLQEALKNPNPELPPDIKAQMNAAPPELPEDLRRQLNNQPTELPEDLKRQLNTPPPPMPDDIRRALETPPRQVTIDEVNTPIDAR